MDHRLPAGVTIRRARPGDAEELAHLHLDVWDDAYTGLIPQEIIDGRRAGLADRIAMWHQITAQEVTPLVALDTTRDPHRPIGFAKAGPARDDDVDTDLELWSLYVRASFWGTGVGHALLASELGDRAAYLWVLDGNERAIGFYERQGFRRDGVVKDEAEGRELRMVRAGR